MDANKIKAAKSRCDFSLGCVFMVWMLPEIRTGNPTRNIAIRRAFQRNSRLRRNASVCPIRDSRRPLAKKLRKTRLASKLFNHEYEGCFLFHAQTISEKS